jgi:hypothetical protein
MINVHLDKCTVRRLNKQFNVIWLLYNMQNVGTPRDSGKMYKVRIINTQIVNYGKITRQKDIPSFWVRVLVNRVVYLTLVLVHFTFCAFDDWAFCTFWGLCILHWTNREICIYLFTHFALCAFSVSTFWQCIYAECTVHFVNFTIAMLYILSKYQHFNCLHIMRVVYISRSGQYLVFHNY